MPLVSSLYSGYAGQQAAGKICIQSTSIERNWQLSSQMRATADPVRTFCNVSQENDWHFVVFASNCCSMRFQHWKHLGLACVQIKSIQVNSSQFKSIACDCCTWPSNRVGLPRIMYIPAFILRNGHNCAKEGQSAFNDKPWRQFPLYPLKKSQID